jgi:hypothetical protein
VIGTTRLQRLLRGANALLGLGILAFCIQGLPRPAGTTLDLKADEELPRSPTRPRDEGDGALKTINNPLQKRVAAVPTNPPLRAALRGTLGGAVAFLRSLARNADLVAFVGGEILQDGRPCDELRGWTLVAAGKDTALFAGPRGERVELTVDLSSAPAAAVSAPAAPKPYAAGSYKSRLLAASEGRQVWGIDADEIAWAAANVPQILDRDLQVVPYAGGGVRVDAVAPDSIGAARGLLPGDILREVDGRPVGGVSDLRSLLDTPNTKTPQSLRVTIERAGKPLLLEYRPLPR